MRKILAVAASTAVAMGALAVGLAAPAAAKTTTIDITCVSGSDIDAAINIEASPGDTIVVNGGAECDFAFTQVGYESLFSSTSAAGAGAPPYTWVISPDAAPGVYGSPVSQVLGVDNDDFNCGSGSLAPYCGRWFYLTITDPTTKDLTIWQKQIGRASADAACEEGYAASWAEWPNEGAGGWVCTKDTYAYYPDEPVL